MKKLRKLLSIMLTIAMVFAMNATVFATQTGTSTAKGEGAFTITLNGAKTGHEYKAYQVFKADLLEQKSGKVLSNVEWSDAVNGPAVVAALKADNSLGRVFGALGNDATARDVVEALQGQNDDNDIMQKFADIIAQNLDTTKFSGSSSESTNSEGKIVYTIGNLTAGYYLVMDNTEAQNVSSNDAFTRYIMQVVGDVESTVKSEIPDIDKKIVEGDNKVDSNTAGIGKTVTFEISGEVPDYTGYDKYFYIINDTLSEGLTFDPDTVTVTVGGEAVEEGTDYYLYTKTTNPAADAPHTFEVAFEDIMQYQAGQEIIVRYSATVNSEAEIGNTGNPNTVNLIYSNDPNHTYDGDENPDKPGTPDPDKDVPKGVGPDHKTITYVAEIDITKYANDKNTVLPGAEFTLTGTSKQTVLGTQKYYEIADNGEYYLLNDGTYTTEAPLLEDEKDEDGNVTKKSNADLYASTTIKYTQKTVTTTSEIDTPVKMVVTSGEDGKVIFKGLGEGTYTIEETVVPAGYNKCENIVIHITCTKPESVTSGEEEATWTKGTGTNPADKIEVGATTGIYATDVINMSGTTLPSTGGIGTTIFYIIGGILVLGAAILLITKKRMSREA